MKIVGITSCSTGIAHTYMAAESLEIAAKKRDIEIKVETQGSIGAENVLTEQEIAEADAVIIAASTSVNKDRFNGKRLLEVDVTEASIIRMIYSIVFRMRQSILLLVRSKRRQKQKKAESTVI